MDNETKQTRCQPTAEMVKSRFVDKGWLTFDDIKYNHLNATEKEKLTTAVTLCREYVEDIKAGKNASLIMVASEVSGDMDRTGYGCGKTTLANIMHRLCNRVQYVLFDDDDFREPEFWIHPIGKFYTSRDLMAMFDKQQEGFLYEFGRIKNMLIIDDLGREGSLKWERRDPEMQLEEKRNRYYTIINHCYEKKINLVITSNLGSREMASFLGGASWSRLLQMVQKKYRINMTGIRDMRPLLADDECF